jgi:hypothetical protein
LDTFAVDTSKRCAGDATNGWAVRIYRANAAEARIILGVQTVPCGFIADIIGAVVEITTIRLTGVGVGWVPNFTGVVSAFSWIAQ